MVWITIHYKAISILITAVAEQRTPTLYESRAATWQSVLAPEASTSVAERHLRKLFCSRVQRSTILAILVLYLSRAEAGTAASSCRMRHLIPIAVDKSSSGLTAILLV